MITPVDLSVDGSVYLSCFVAAAGSDFIAQLGLSNATNELMAGNFYQWGGLHAYYRANGTSGDSGTGGGTLGGVTWADRNCFMVISLTKTNSATTNDVAAKIDIYDLGNVDAANITGGPFLTTTLNLTGVTGSFNTLKFKLDGGGGGGVNIDEIRVGQSLTDVTTGGVDPDSDTDGLLDVWENLYFGDLSHDGSQGAVNGDADGLTDLEEFTLGTNPTLADTDIDGLDDGPEIDGSLNTAYWNEPTDPLDNDSDDDGLLDGAEVNGSPVTNPNSADTDADGWNDKTELLYGTDPTLFEDVPAVHELIGLDKRNGGFELLDGVVNPAKANT